MRAVDQIMSMVKSLTIAEIIELRQKLNDEFGEPDIGVREPLRPFPKTGPSWAHK